MATSRTRPAGVSPAEFRAIALALPEASEASHMSHPDFRVRNRIFATLIADETRGVVKCDATNVDALVRSQPDVYSDEWHGRWLGIELSRAAQPAVAALVEDAWRMIAPKRLAAAHSPAEQSPPPRAVKKRKSASALPKQPARPPKQPVVPPSPPRRSHPASPAPTRRGG